MPITGCCPICGVPVQLPEDAAGCGFACVKCGSTLAATTAGQVVTQPVPAAPNPFSDVANPYAAPGAGYGPSFVPPPFSREDALAKVRVPAIVLIVYGALYLLGSLPLVAVGILGPTADESERVMMIAVFSVIAGLGIATGGLTVFCGLRMSRLSSYGLVIAGIIVTFFVALMVCPLLMVVGIWPMVVLLDARVRAHFR